MVDADRSAAIARLARALDETVVTGIQTTLPFHRFVARHDGFRDGALSTDWVGEEWAPVVEADRARALEAASWAAAAGPASAHEGGAITVAEERPRSAWSRDGRERAVDRWPR